jgi:hypothetical protein
MDIVVLDPGPIRHAELHRFDDLDIEAGLEHGGHSAEDATYRLIEVDLDHLEDTRHFPFDWQPTHALERLRAGEETPPIVVVQTVRRGGLGIIDGLNRAYAHWLEGSTRIRGYELLLGGHS